MENKKVMIKNMTNGRVVIKVPDLNFKRIWERKNAVKPVDFEILQQAFYDEGVEYLFKERMLYITDEKIRVELGLEDEENKIIILDDNMKKRYLTVLPVNELKEKLKELTKEQILELADYAINNEIVNMEVKDLLKEYTGIDIIRAIELNRQMKEV